MVVRTHRKIRQPHPNVLGEVTPDKHHTPLHGRGTKLSLYIAGHTAWLRITCWWEGAMVGVYDGCERDLTAAEHALKHRERLTVRRLCERRGRHRCAKYWIGQRGFYVLLYLFWCWSSTQNQCECTVVCCVCQNNWCIISHKTTGNQRYNTIPEFTIYTVTPTIFIWTHP